MGNLLRFELRKLFKARVFYICLIVLAATVLVLMGTQKLTDLLTEDVMGGEVSQEELYSEEDQELMESMSMGIFSTARTGLAWVLNALDSFYIFIAFGACVAVWFMGDYSSRTVQHEITKGYTRTEIFFSKYLSSLFICFVYALAAMVIGFVFGSLFWKVGKEFSWKFIALVLIQFLLVAAFNAMFCFFASLTFKMAPALILSIAIPIGIPIILGLVDLFVQLNAPLESETVFQSTDYWLSGMLSGVSGIKAKPKDIWHACIGGAAYLSAFTVFGWLLAKKRDA